jgi:hypothetical protein
MAPSPPLADDKLNATPMWTDHPAHHNALADAVNGLRGAWPTSARWATT